VASEMQANIHRSTAGISSASTSSRRPAGRRGALAIAFALAALALALAAAIAPASAQRATYSWPPRHVPQRQPERSWFAPLMLNQRAAESIRVHLPCRVGRLLPGAGSKAVVLATARQVRRYGALEISRLGSRHELLVRVGSSELGHFAVPASGPCALDVRISGRQWTIRQSEGRANASGKLAARVGVNGLFTQLDLRAKPGLRVEVTPTTQDTRPSTTQTALRILAVLTLAVALWLLLGDARVPRPRPVLRRLLPAPRLPDAFVALSLAAWWIVSPVSFDDGWVTARQTNSLRSGGFSNYYDHAAANLPFGTWLEWLQHLVVAHTGVLILQRLPSVVCLAALWLVCRAILFRLVGAPSGQGRPAWWSAAVVFCVGMAAFGVTLRPEPVNALLVAGVLLCMLRFSDRPALGPLAAAALLAGLALSEHPEGIVALAPILACLPRIVREVRSRATITFAGVGTVLVCGLAWTALLAFLDSDLHHRLRDSRLFSEGGGHSYGITGEWLRYKWLWQLQGLPLSKEFPALLVLSVLAFVTRSRRGRPPGERLPAISVGLGLVLLALVPSKWLWHFGVFIGLGTAAAGVEVARLHEGLSSRKRSSLVRPVSAVVAVLIATIWAALQPPLSDIASGRKIPGTVTIAALSIIWALVVLLTLPAAAALKGRASAARRAWHAGAWCLPLMLAPILILGTLGLALRWPTTPGWTYTRQNVDALIGREKCGLADDLVVPDPRSMSVLPRISSPTQPSLATRTIRARNAGGDLFAVEASSGSSSLPRSPWYRVPIGGRPVGFFLGGTWRGSGAVDVTWGRTTGRAVVPTGVGKANLAGAGNPGHEPATWRFVAQSRLPARPPEADAVRLSIGGVDGRSTGFVTAPISYSRVRLSAGIERASAVTLVSPNLLESMPCARLPTVELGAGQPPTLLVDWKDAPFMTDAGGPFGAIPDLFQLRRLPLSDSKHPAAGVSVYELAVDRRDAVAPATATRW
jgi:hypothetical protein